MPEISNLPLSFVLSFLFVLPGTILCLFTVRETLTIGWPWLIPIVLGGTALYLGLRILTWLGTLPFLVIVFFLYCRISQAEPHKLLYILMIVVTYLLFSNAVFFIFERSTYTWTWDDLDTIILGFCTSMPPMTWFLRRQVWPRLRELETAGHKGLWVVPVTFMTLNTVLCSSHIQSLLSPSLSLPYTIVTTLFSIASAGICFFVLVMLQNATNMTRYEDRIRYMDIQLASQARRFEEISAHMDEIRILRHDVRHHLRAMQALLSEGDIEGAKAYLDEFSLKATEADATPLCENHIIDLALRQLQLQASENDIEVTLDVATSGPCWVHDIDLCIILGNLTENAMHATLLQRSGRRFIHVEIRGSQREFAIILTNSFDDSPRTEARLRAVGLAKGTGQGIPSVRIVAEKHGGGASFTSDGDVFTASVLLLHPKVTHTGP